MIDESGKVKIRQLASDDWYFVAEANAYGTQFFKTSKQNLGTILPVTIELGRGGILNGTVRDEQGNPVSGADVSFSLAEISMSPSYGKVATNERGEWTKSSLPLRREIGITVTHPDYEYQRETKRIIALTGSIAQVIKKRPKGISVSFIVVDEEGRPIEGAWLYNYGSNSRDVVKFSTNAQGLNTQNRNPAGLSSRWFGFSLIINIAGDLC